VAADAAWRVSSVIPRRAALALVALAVAALGARAARRNRDWSDDVTLFSSAVRVEPKSLLAHFNLGVALKDAGDLDHARREWDAALAIKPDDPGTNAQLGTLLAVRGDLAGAELHYRMALRGNPRLAEARFNLGQICERTGRLDEARGHYRSLLDAPASEQGGMGEQARARLRALAAVR
jgi:Flp pilus assembly protein TadD